MPFLRLRAKGYALCRFHAAGSVGLRAATPWSAVRGGQPSRCADGLPAIHLVEHAGALRALDDVRCQTHQFVWLDLVTVERVGNAKTKLGFPLNRGAIIRAAHLPYAPAFGSSGARACRGTPPTAGSAYAHGKADGFNCKRRPDSLPANVPILIQAQHHRCGAYFPNPSVSIKL
jgi:hypothetical protein